MQNQSYSLNNNLYQGNKFTDITVDEFIEKFSPTIDLGKIENISDQDVKDFIDENNVFNKAIIMKGKYHTLKISDMHKYKDNYEESLKFKDMMKIYMLNSRGENIGRKNNMLKSNKVVIGRGNDRRIEGNAEFQCGGKSRKLPKWEGRTSLKYCGKER